MSKRITQRDRVRKWLEDNGSITNVEAVRDLRVYRLSERIRELEGHGLVITGEWADKSTGLYRYILASGPKKKFVPQFVLVNGVRKVRMVAE